MARSDTGEGKVHPMTGQEGPGMEKRYSSTLSLNLGDILEWVVNATPRPFYLLEKPGTHCIGGWVGPRAGQDRCQPYSNKSEVKQSLFRSNRDA